MLLDILFSINNVTRQNDQFTLKLVDIYFDKTLQILSKSLQYFEKIENWMIYVMEEMFSSKGPAFECNTGVTQGLQKMMMSHDAYSTRST